MANVTSSAGSHPTQARGGRGESGGPEGEEGGATPAHRPRHARVRPRRAAWTVDLLLAAVVLLVVAPVLQPLMAQQASRYALTAALYDSGTVVIDDYADAVTVDRAEREGRLYSDKAPGQPVLAVPAYAVYRLFGGAPATQARPLGDLGLWSVNLISSALPAAVLAVLMRRFAARTAPGGATVAALAMSMGTLLLPFATQLFSHLLSAMLSLGAYLLLTWSPRARQEGGPVLTPAWVLAGAGLVAGVGVTVEFTLGLVVVLLGVIGLYLHGWRTVWYVLGGALPAVLLGLYNTVAFGGPLRLSYEFSGFAQHQDGLVGAQLPTLRMAAAVLVGERGLFTLTPLVAVGLVGCVLLVHAGGRVGPVARRDALVALATFGVMAALMSGWSNATGGASPGPRYAVPALPFLAVGVAWVWERRREWVVAATALGAAVMLLATFTLPLAQQAAFTPVALQYWIDLAAEANWARTLLSPAGGSGWLLLPPLAAAAALCVPLLRTSGDPSSGVGEAR